MRKNSAIVGAIAPVLETLESRQMLSVVTCYVQVGTGTSPTGQQIVTRQLVLNGSRRGDNLTVSGIGNDDGTGNFTVKNGVGGRVSRAYRGITSVVVNTGNGNDTVLVSGDGLGDDYIPVNIVTGDGNDTVRAINFDGALSVNVGNGNNVVDLSQCVDPDAILGMDSGCSVGCGSGNNLIIGSAANDNLTGGIGNDTINGGDGDDYISGGRGKNVLNGGDGDDTFSVLPLNGLGFANSNGWDVGGYDVINGGTGNDTVYHAFNSSSPIVPQYGDKLTGVENVFASDYGGGKG